VGSGVGSRVPLDSGLLSRETGRGGAGTTPVIPSGPSLDLPCACSAACLRRSPAPPRRGVKALATVAAEAAFRKAPAISPLDFFALIIGPRPGRDASSSSAAGGGRGAGAGSFPFDGDPASPLGSIALAGLFVVGMVSKAGELDLAASGFGDFGLSCSGDCVEGGVAAAAGGGVLRSWMFPATELPMALPGL
jgi:hypothetical protein